MQIIIIESPAKTKTIEKYLSTDYGAPIGSFTGPPSKDASDWDRHAGGRVSLA